MVRWPAYSNINSTGNLVFADFQWLKFSLCRSDVEVYPWLWLLLCDKDGGDDGSFIITFTSDVMFSPITVLLLVGWFDGSRPE